MKRQISIFILLLFSSMYIKSQIPVTKQLEGIWGGTEVENLLNIEVAPDSSYFLVGGSYSDSLGVFLHNWRGASDGWLLHIDKNGNYLWDKRYGGIGDDELSDILYVDSAFLIIGHILSDSGYEISQHKRGWADIWVIKIDMNGNKLWDKRYGGDSISSSYALKLLETHDAGYLIAGWSNSDSLNEKTGNCFGGADFWPIKIDSLGNKLWDKTYGGNNTDLLFSVVEDSLHNYYLSGYSASPASGNKSAMRFGPAGTLDFWVVKIDSVGNKIWDKSYGGINDEYLRGSYFDGNNLFLGGWSNSPPSGNKTSTNHNNSPDYWVVKIDTAGNIVWDKSYGGNGNDYATHFSKIKNNQFLITGNSFSNISGEKSENNLGISSDSWLICFDSNGNKIWDKTIFNYGYDQLSFASLTEDSCLLFAASTDTDIPGGYCDSVTYGDYDFWMVKLCGEVFTGAEEIVTEQNGLKLFPNPFVNTFKLQTQNMHVSKIILKNIVGQTVFEKTVNKNEVEEIEINPGAIARGVYFVTVTNKDGNLTTGKIVKN